MSLLLAGALALSLQQTPDQFGSDVFHMGGCEHAGWSLDRVALVERFHERIAASGLSQPDFEAIMATGVDRAADEFQAQGVSVGGRAQAQAFLTVIRDRCEALTASYPQILSRSSETEAGWSAFSQGVLSRYPE